MTAGNGKSRLNIRIKNSNNVFPSTISDETSCQLVLLEPSYLKTVPPPPMEGKQKAEVEVEVDLISILDIKEVDYIISLQIDLRLTWLDK